MSHLDSLVYKQFQSKKRKLVLPSHSTTAHQQPKRLKAAFMEAFARSRALTDKAYVQLDESIEFIRRFAPERDVFAPPNRECQMLTRAIHLNVHPMAVALGASIFQRVSRKVLAQPTFADAQRYVLGDGANDGFKGYLFRGLYIQPHRLFHGDTFGIPKEGMVFLDSIVAYALCVNLAAKYVHEPMEYSLPSLLSKWGLDMTSIQATLYGAEMWLLEQIEYSFLCLTRLRPLDTVDA